MNEYSFMRCRKWRYVLKYHYVEEHQWQGVIEPTSFLSSFVRVLT